MISYFCEYITSSISIFSSSSSNNISISICSSSSRISSDRICTAVCESPELHTSTSIFIPVTCLNEIHLSQRHAAHIIRAANRLETYYVNLSNKSKNNWDSWRVIKLTKIEIPMSITITDHNKERYNVVINSRFYWWEDTTGDDSKCVEAVVPENPHDSIPWGTDKISTYANPPIAFCWS